jgi:hypothetical protein
MEELLDKVFLDSTANDLNFIYYKQRHFQLEVFFRAIQMQRRHEEFYRVVAVEGIHPDQFFEFEKTLCKHVAEIESVLPTVTTIMVNRLGDTTFCVRNPIFLSWQTNFTRNSLVFIISTCRTRR